MTKKTLIILGILAGFKASASEYVLKNATYELVGPAVCTDQNSMEISAVVHDRFGNLIGSAFVTCEVFEKLKNCETRTGTLTYDDGESFGYDFPDSVSDFTCRN